MMTKNLPNQQNNKAVSMVLENVNYDEKSLSNLKLGNTQQI